MRMVAMWTIAGVGGVLSMVVFGLAGCTGQSSDRSAVTAMADTAATPEEVGAAATLLGPGTYIAGQHLDPGLYEVTVKSGARALISGGMDELDPLMNLLELLAAPELAERPGSPAVAKLRLELSDGDEVVLSAGPRQELGEFTLAFTPVASRRIEPIGGTVILYSGRWSVGDDLAPGRYVLEVDPGVRGSLQVVGGGHRGAVELLDGDGADGGRPSVSLDLSIGDRIAISGIDEVTFTTAGDGG